MHDSVARGAMETKIRNLSLKAHVLCFQEVHGLNAEVSHSFQRWLPGWRIFSSECQSADGMLVPSAGGIACATCLTLSRKANFEQNILVPGRCMSLAMSLGDRVLTVVNLHNYAFSVSDVLYVGEFLSRLAAEVTNPGEC